MVSYRLKRKLVPWLYVAPATLLFGLLMLFPMLTVLRYSLQDGAITKKDASFVGFQNYFEIFNDPVFWQSVGQTLYFTIMSVVFHLLIGLVLPSCSTASASTRRSGACFVFCSSCPGSTPP